jgi:hypothetical protein
VSGTYYQWLAESIVMTDRTMVRDLLAAIGHALDVPGEITPAQADRLGKLGLEIKKLVGDEA